MTKVVKLQLYYIDDNLLEFKKAQEALWQLQKETRAASNRVIQMCWEFNNFSSDWKTRTGDYLTKEETKEIMGKSFRTVMYDRIKGDAPTSNTANLGTTLQAVYGKFNSMIKGIMRGDISIPSFKKDLPIDLHKNNIVLNYEKDKNGAVSQWIFTLSLFSKNAKKDLGLKVGCLSFKAVVPARSKKFVEPILERCYDGIYEICSSKLKYDNGRWYLMLCFSFQSDKSNIAALNKKNIMGVHIGEHNAVTCTFSNSKKRLTIEGGEVVAFATQIENRRRQIGKASRKHSKLCGDGRVGHGYKAKMQPLDKIGSKVANYRNTVNHRYSRQIIDWAVENNCGTIQLEDLTGYAASELEKYKLLKGWSYYDLQNKIETKASEYDINVVKIGYEKLKKWCSDCCSPTIKAVDIDGKEQYVCQNCGQAFDVDYTVEKAVSIPNITELLKE